MNDWMRLPSLASAHGGQLDHTLGLVHLLMFVLFIGWGAFFVYVLMRFRKSRNPQADYNGVQSHTNTWLEGAVFVAEVVLLVGFSIPLWADRVDGFPAPNEATTVRVVAEQFAWNVHYPGPDGMFGKTDINKINVQTNPIGLDRNDPAAADDVTTLNQLHVPVNKPVLVHLSSKDVIHSFGLQEMRVKQDAIPGHGVPVWFTPTVTTEEMRARTGAAADWTYEIACAQLCGIGHYRMRGFLTVHTPEAYAQWMAEQVSQIPSAEDAAWE